MIEHKDSQGTEGWLESRRGVITASRAKDARDRKKDGSPSDKMLTYAMDVARERCGGKAASVYVNAAMRTGHEEEPFAQIAYMERTGFVVETAGFFTTDDRKFGMSPDGLIPTHRGANEVKTMVASSTLFKAVVTGDISEYRDQCLFGLWLFALDWIDLCLWAADLQLLTVIRIERDEEEIQALEDDLMKFDALVSSFEARLRSKLPAGTVAADTSPPWDVVPVTPRAATALPADIFA